MNIPPEVMPFFQLLMTFVAGITGVVISFTLAIRLEPFKANVGFKIKQQEIRYARLYDKRIEALEGLHYRLTNLIDAAAGVTAIFQNINQREGKTLPENIALDRAEKVQRVYDAGFELYTFHNQKGLYLPKDITLVISKFNEGLWRIITAYHFFSGLERMPPLEMMEKWKETEEKIEEAKKTRDDLDRKFRELLIQEGLFEVS
jgi:hypothetical protein